MKNLRLLLLIALPLCALPMRAQKMVIVVNPNSKVDEIGMNDLRGIFLGTSTRFRNGSNALPVLLRSGPEHDQFLAEFIGKVDPSFRSVWRSLVFTGVASMPKNEDDDAAMIAYVAANPGAIGYVSKATPRDKVKTVTVTP